MLKFAFLGAYTYTPYHWSSTQREREEEDTSEFGQRKTERVLSMSERGNEWLEHPNTRPQENAAS